MSIIAVASQNRREITGHTGMCRRFWLYEVREHEVKHKRLLELGRDQSLHASQPGVPHPLDAARVLISAGMGTGLVDRLQRKGIEAVITPETDPDVAVKRYVEGTLTRGEAHAHDHGEHHCNCGHDA